MPEGDTIYKAATALRKALAGREITRFDTDVPAVAAVNARTPVAGRVVIAVEARGKHLLTVFRQAGAEQREPVPDAERLALDLWAGDLVLHTHMRMTGSWHIYRPGERWPKPARLARVTLYTEEFTAPCFSAPVVELLTARDAARHPDLTALGPDAITEEFDAVEARRRMRLRPDLEIGVALLLQRTMAGVGNVFKSEVLFIRRISPFRKVASLSDDELDGLIGECHRLLLANRTAPGRRTRFGLDRGQSLWVYGRSGAPCRVCGAAIQMRRQGLDGRSTYYCPECQAVTPR